MSFAQKALIAFVTILAIKESASDVTVQLNVNRPFNDVNEKFVSFAIQPEELYKALDGPHRKSMTRMASMLGDSYVKFVGDYYFASNSEMKLRNPTKIIWKGFNRWTRAVNWTMIIPVPYSPSSWDPMHALKILNSSHLIGVSDCIWQLGTDFGTSRAQDYVTELGTLNLMVGSFKPYVDNWQIMGADISAGSSPDETRRYIDMSKDLNAAFGWTQPAELVPSNSLSSYIYENDPALKVLISKKVPVWLSLPQKASSSKKSKQNHHRFIGDETTDALRWAQTLGDAASMGFDAIFKRISVSDLERPDFSFYVTALFKKVMGSRVFPARPLHVFGRSNKLYTHCANAVSGGIAFLVVNMDEKPLQISVRSTTKFTGTEVWQYALTSKKGVVLLNNEKLTLNSTLKPQIKIKNPDKPVPLSTPGMSVCFWVLPAVNLEHCQYTEIETDEVSKESGEKILEKRYSSSDRLLRKLIQETSLAHSALARAINRRRRYATFSTNNKRQKRFILEDSSRGRAKGFGKLFEPIVFDEKILKKRNDDIYDGHKSPLEWIKKLMDNPLKTDLLNRNRRSSDNYFGPFFSTKDGRKTAFTRKITEIKKPEKKVKPIFDLEEFDEEKFFKSIDVDSEPEPRRMPEGDVHMKHITNVDGEEVEDYKEERLKKKSSKKSKNKKVEEQSQEETVSEMKPLRLLPTEFYEALPVHSFKPVAHKMNLGGALNSLLFAEPFSKKLNKNKKKMKSKNEEDLPASDSVSEVEEVGSRKFHQGGQLAKDFLQAQKELRKTFLKDQANKKSSSHEDYAKRHEENQDEEEDELEDKRAKSQTSKFKSKYDEFSPELMENYFGENDDQQAEEEKPKTKRKSETTKTDLDKAPWWDMGLLRHKRALQFQIPDESWRANMIDKDDDLMPLGAMMPPEQLLPIYEYQADGSQSRKEMSSETIPSKLVATVKQKVSNFVDIVTRHVSEWYNTLTKHIDVEATTLSNNVN